MNVFLKKTIELFKECKSDLDEFNDKPPLTFPKKLLEPINKITSLLEWSVRVFKNHDERIAELEKQLSTLAPQATEAATDDK